MTKKQTSVEWLIEQLNPDMKTMQGNIIQDLLDQAKAMHKDEIISFGYQCAGAMESELGDIIYNKLPEDIYNDTFEI